MADFKQKEKYTGEWKGNTISFNREWSGHRFTDAECEALLNGNEIIIEAVSKKTGNKFSVAGSLGDGFYEGKSFVAFQPDFNKKIIPISFCGHIFSNKERKDLENGKTLLLTDLKSKKGTDFTANITFNDKDGLDMSFDNLPSIGKE